MTTITNASQIKPGQFLVENGGASFEVLKVEVGQKTTKVTCDTSMFFASFRTNFKTFEIKNKSRVCIVSS